MSTERRGPHVANRFKLSPDTPSSGPFKGYERLDRVHSAATRDKGMKFCNLMHHFNFNNLMQAFRELDGSKASGIDRMTKEKYRENLEENLIQLEAKVRGGGWRPKPAREVLIPKPQGGFRSLAVGCLEDKIVQIVLAKILEATHEPLFHERSYGFRPGRSAHQAIAYLYGQIKQKADKCTIVDTDIEKFFDKIDHQKMMEYISRRIQDAHLLRLVFRALRNSILSTTGETRQNYLGSPQGSPASPILANIYLHYLLDEWFQENWGHEGRIVRYADDAVFVFSNWAKANEFKLALEVRLFDEGKLKLNLDKSKVILFSNTRAAGEIQFLGFNFYWGRKMNRVKMLKLKTNPKRLGKSISNFTNWIKKYRNLRKLETLWDMAKARIQGHYNYFRLSFNQSKLNHFYQACIWVLFKWLNRRSQRRSFTWKQFREKLKRDPLPTPPLGHQLKDITLGVLH